MRTIRRPSSVPPSGYVYIVPETGTELRGGDMASLVRDVRAHYVVNALPVPPDLPARIEHYICLQNVESVCQGPYEPGDVPKAVITVTGVKEATRMVRMRLKWAKDDFLVSQDEAERRAAICTQCPKNYRGICTTCNGLADYVKEAVAGRVTSHDKQLGVCVHCSCLLPVKVHISKAALAAASKLATPAGGEAYPEHCWLREGF